jgi:hypothetical protein
MAEMMQKGPTGYRHGKCYANRYGDCSTKISREHFISENLLRRIHLTEPAKIAGLAWQDREKFDIVPIKGLASNILCQRHDEALSRLDAMKNAAQGGSASARYCRRSDLRRRRRRRAAPDGSNEELRHPAGLVVLKKDFGVAPPVGRRLP